MNPSAAHQSDDFSFDLTQYIQAKQIGKGGFGVVYQVIDKRTNQIYAAKISLQEVDFESQKSIRELKREVNILAMVRFASILSFVGFSPTDFEGKLNPVIVTEYLPNGSLDKVIELSNKGLSIDGWDTTRRLINLYGIASGMSFLHSHGIVHRDLKTENVFVDEYLFPKIGDFGLSKMITNKSSTDVKSTTGIKGTLTYISPEIFEKSEYSPAGDVYAFAFIIYEVMTDEKLLTDLPLLPFLNQVVYHSYRPELKRPLPPAYKELLESCWSQKPEDRPTFSEIANRLQHDPEFRIEGVDSDSYEEYIEYVSAYDQQFKRENQILHARDFLNQTNSQSFKAIIIHHKSEMDSGNPPSNIEGKTKLIEVDRILTSQEMNELNETCRLLVEESSGDPSKEFIIGRNFIEGLNDFPINRSFGMKFVRRSSSSENIEASIYLAEIYYKGDIIVKDYQKCIEILESYQNSGNVQVLRLLGKASRKLQHYEEALHYFEEASSNCDNESMYQYGKMLYLGEGIARDEKRAEEYFQIVRQNGYNKQYKFLHKLNDQVPQPSPKSNPSNEEACQQLLQSLVRKAQNENLVRIDIPKGIQRLNDKAFYYCKSLKTVTIPSSVTSIGNECFYLCESLTQVAIPSSVGSIGDKCFSLCSSLIEITIPPSIMVLGDECFYRCESLTQITIPSSVTSIENECFANCISLAQITIPSSVTSIGYRCFSFCSSLKQITIPSSVTSIGDFCFHNCESLEQITLPSSSLTLLRMGLFENCFSLRQIEIPSSVASLESQCFSQCKSLQQITIPSSVISLDYFCFSYCSSLTQITIPSSVTSISDYCFESCSSLAQITIPSSVTSLGAKSFYNCSSLAQITIPSSVTSIGDECFSQCTSLTQVTFNSSSIELGKKPFYKCKELKTITAPKGLKFGIFKLPFRTKVNRT